MAYYTTSVTDVARSPGTTPAGLNPATAQRRLAESGPNQLADGRKKTVWLMLLHQFTDVMVVVLLAAAVISGVVGEVKSTYVILAIVLLNALIGFVHEYRAKKSMEALKKMATNRAQVLRGGQVLSVAWCPAT